MFVLEEGFKMGLLLFLNKHTTHHNDWVGWRDTKAQCYCVVTTVSLY